GQTAVAEHGEHGRCDEADRGGHDVPKARQRVQRPGSAKQDDIQRARARVNRHNLPVTDLARMQWDLKDVSYSRLRSFDHGSSKTVVRIVVRPAAAAGNPTKEARYELENEWARVASIHRPADYESAALTS